MALGREGADHLVKASCSMEFLVWPPYDLILSITAASLVASAASVVAAVSVVSAFIDAFVSSFVAVSSGSGAGELSVHLRRYPHAVRGSVGDGHGSSDGGSSGRGGRFRWRDGRAQRGLFPIV